MFRLKEKPAGVKVGDKRYQSQSLTAKIPRCVCNMRSLRALFARQPVTHATRAQRSTVDPRRFQLRRGEMEEGLELVSDVTNSARYYYT